MKRLTGQIWFRIGIGMACDAPANSRTRNVAVPALRSSESSGEIRSDKLEGRGPETDGVIGLGNGEKVGPKGAWIR